MRPWLIAALLLLAGAISTASGQTDPFHAGIARFQVAAGEPLDVLVWYPTDAPEVPWQAGPFTIPATRNAPFAPGRFPVVLLSHGGGTTGGTPLILREISASLARQGFLVIAPFHRKTGLPDRPLQVERALEAVRADPRFAPHADPVRLGMLGFSLGATVTLELAGAVPNVAHLTAYCAAHPDDAMSCDHAPDGNKAPAAARPPAPLPLKAIVLLDPFAVLFQREELTAVTMPVLLFRPEQSELPGDANAFGLAASLPHPPRSQTVPGRHFIFVDVCPPDLRSSAPELCEDPPGVDREAIHAGIERQIAEFFHANL